MLPTVGGRPDNKYKKLRAQHHFRYIKTEATSAQGRKRERATIDRVCEEEVGHTFYQNDPVSAYVENWGLVHHVQILTEYVIFITSSIFTHDGVKTWGNVRIQ